MNFAASIWSPVVTGNAIFECNICQALNWELAWPCNFITCIVSLCYRLDRLAKRISKIGQIYIHVYTYWNCMFVQWLSLHVSIFSDRFSVSRLSYFIQCNSLRKNTLKKIYKIYIQHIYTYYIRIPKKNCTFISVTNAIKSKFVNFLPAKEIFNIIHYFLKNFKLIVKIKS